MMPAWFTVIMLNEKYIKTQEIFCQFQRQEMQFDILV